MGTRGEPRESSLARKVEAPRNSRREGLLDCAPQEDTACVVFFPAVSPASGTVPGAGLVLKANVLNQYTNEWMNLGVIH